MEKHGAAVEQSQLQEDLAVDPVLIRVIRGQKTVTIAL